MRSIVLNCKMALAALVAACFLVLPAWSMPLERGIEMHGHAGMIYALNNVTPEELGNMTLGEIKEMTQSALNTTIAPLAGDDQAGNEMRNSRPGQDRRLLSGGRTQDAGGCMAYQGSPYGMFGGYGIFDSNAAVTLLMDDITVEELGEMSLNEILSLQEEKMQELEGMTLNEIRELWQEKVQAQNNMTINELVSETRDMQAMEGIMGWVSNQYRRLIAKEV